MISIVLVTSTTHRCIVEVKVCLLYTLAVVALRVGQAEQALFEEWTSSSQQMSLNGHGRRLHVLFLIPERKSDVLQAVGVANPGNTVFAPSVRARSGVVVGKV